MKEAGDRKKKRNLPLAPYLHVSQLKRHIGPRAVPTPDLPLIDEKGNIKVATIEILERRMIPRVRITGVSDPRGGGGE